jgi:transcriptional regulator with XRE-family HTH domain
MTYGGSLWSEAFIRDLENKEFRDEFVADQTRARIALLIRALREQEDRNWSQAELGRQMGGKPQSVISRLEDPDYGKLSVQTLLETAAAFGLPLWIDMPEWEEWLQYIRDVPSSTTRRRSFDTSLLASKARAATGSGASSKIISIVRYRDLKAGAAPQLKSSTTSAPSVAPSGISLSVSVA